MCRHIAVNILQEKKSWKHQERKEQSTKSSNCLKKPEQRGQVNPKQADEGNSAD